MTEPLIVDLHLHSHYSRATSKNLDLVNLYCRAKIKGIDVLGTADFTHPQWLAELQTQLEVTDGGLYRLKPEIIAEIEGVKSTKSKRVQSIYRQLINQLGDEFRLLRQVDTVALANSGHPDVAVAIERMRHGDLIIEPGYDGATVLFVTGSKKPVAV